MKSGTMLQPVLTALLALSLTGPAQTLAAEEKAPVPTKEVREKMAAAHEKMAACLRTETPFAECRTQMQKQCQQTMGEQGCSMMMGRGMGMMHESTRH